MSWLFAAVQKYLQNEVGVVMVFGNKGIAYRSFVAVGRDQVKAVTTPASAVTASYSPFASC
jgi:hypothetical protein